MAEENQPSQRVDVGANAVDVATLRDLQVKKTSEQQVTDQLMS